MRLKSSTFYKYNEYICIVLMLKFDVFSSNVYSSHTHCLSTPKLRQASNIVVITKMIIFLMNLILNLYNLVMKTDVNQIISKLFNYTLIFSENV